MVMGSCECSYLKAQSVLHTNCEKDYMNLLSKCQATIDISKSGMNSVFIKISWPSSGP